MARIRTLVAPLATAAALLVVAETGVRHLAIGMWHMGVPA